jgi:hypothetical protein
MSLQALLNRYMDQQGLYSVEGRRGVEHLAKVVNALGYSDSINRYGQMQGGACLGDIFTFLEDNPGAIEALVEWIGSRNSPEWTEALQSQVIPADDDDLVADHFKDCPDCGHEIPDGTTRGEECENCGHVFNWGPTDDGSDNWKED